MKKILIFIIGGVLLTQYSCVREGCTDEVALNYDSKAKKDDGSCNYDKDNEQLNNNHYYSLISQDGDTLLYGSVPNYMGGAQTWLSSDGLYLSVYIEDSLDNGVTVAGGFFINDDFSLINNSIEPDTSLFSNGVVIDPQNSNGVFYWGYYGDLEFQNLVTHHMPDGDALHKRVTLTVNFDGTFLNINEEVVWATLSITISN